MMTGLCPSTHFGNVYDTVLLPARRHSIVHSSTAHTTRTDQDQLHHTKGEPT